MLISEGNRRSLFDSLLSVEGFCSGHAVRQKNNLSPFGNTIYGSLFLPNNMNAMDHLGGRPSHSIVFVYIREPESVNCSK